MIGRILSWAFILPIRFYRYFISPMLPASCRYYPSCSSYAMEALSVHGPLKGGWFTLKRLGRCHPFGGEGYDPVPHKHGNCHHGATGLSGRAHIE
ncbi:membrane protein insertion efficiency factor YidD [Sneathiella sp.]|uniref:membrane protein insertion efficiency factor YidD n=1 Tax=Sneathiella sp. TaxID=1964365 RepID=UPI00262764EF|nr:membrane protein insertion efficiency factor YidD [Sneathiella sp.]MDF2366595.1 membrane protein insertion efficiency factor YidD [Sneathiella sp.]